MRGQPLFFVFLLFFHQPCAAVPSLPDFPAYGIIAVLHLVKKESVQFPGIDLALIIQYLLVRQHIYDPARRP